ncbi:hypothetical protein GALMADRAFT_278691 [Galerina marginata CBS 339.88]|uniref:Uncharacterized protein n=1 Tax=Galerina marginata (strain CBS 339.88) TaxID=685588 RepID=A0A067T304_GALM3|nr:hypothetical protein GALMADRAFT_278691 [Galerina marginata CBS 339.88]
MHQSHNIPWDILASNYHFVRANKELKPDAHTGILPIPSKRTHGHGHGHGAQELKHFIRKFADTIRLFSTTERLKSAPAGSETDSSLIILAQRGKKLFPAALLLKHPSILTEQNQKPEYWYDFRSRSFTHRPDEEGEQVLRILMHSPSTPTLSLLFLAQHPHITQSNLWSWEKPGYSGVTAAALAAYVFFNAADAVDALETGAYAEADNYRVLLAELAYETDVRGQEAETVHMAFLRECGVLVDGRVDAAALARGAGVGVHGDYERLRKYLKELFVLLYRFDCYYRQAAGRDMNWEDQISYCAPFRTFYGVPNPVKPPWREC